MLFQKIRKLSLHPRSPLKHSFLIQHFRILLLLRLVIQFPHSPPCLYHLIRILQYQPIVLIHRLHIHIILIPVLLLLDQGDRLDEFVGFVLELVEVIHHEVDVLGDVLAE